MGENSHSTKELTSWQAKEKPQQPLGDKAKELGQNTLSRRVLITGAAATIAGGILGGNELRSILNKSDNESKRPTPDKENVETSAVVVSPELMVTNEKRDFSELELYKEAPFMKYDPETNRGEVSKEPEIILVKPASFQEQIVLRKGPTLRNEGAEFIQKGSVEFDEMMDKTFAVTKLLGPGYGDTGSPGRPNLPPGEDGGTWYAILGARQDRDGTITYHYADQNGNRLPPGEAPICFSATFGNAVEPQ